MKYLFLVFALVPQLGQSQTPAEHLEMGNMLRKKMDYPTAWVHYSAAARSGNTEAIMAMGYMIVRREISDGIDFTYAIQKFRSIASDKNPDAYYAIGSVYYYSDNIRNMDSVIYYFKKAEKAGSIDAIYMLGSLYYMGEGVKADPFIARDYFELAIKKGSVPAYTWLGNLYLQGTFCFKKDELKAKELFEKGAALGSGFDMAALAGMYEKGFKGQSSNIDSAVAWYRRSIAAGNVYGMNYLSMIYANNLKYYDPVASKRLLDSAVTKAGTFEIYNIGNEYVKKNSIQKNCQLGVSLLRIALARGEKKSLIALALTFENGCPYYKPDSAIILLKLAESNGTTWASNTLGAVYYQRSGYENLIKAQQCFEKARDQGYPNYYGLGVVYEVLAMEYSDRGRERTELKRKAREAYQMAVETTCDEYARQRLNKL